MKIILLFCYIHSISTSCRVSGTPRNTTIDLKNNINSQNGNISKTSRLVSTNYSFKKRSSKPGIMKQDKNGHIFDDTIFLDMSLPKSQCKLSKEATDFLLWLDMDPAPSNHLSHLKIFRKNTLKSVVKHREEILELFKKKSSNPISSKAKKQAGKPRKIQEKKTMSRRWTNNSIYLDQEKMINSLPWNNSAGLQSPYLKRFRRQAEAEGAELPRWPGAPQASLRQNLNESRVKRKILHIMKQSLYSAQEHLWPVGSIVQKYEHLTPYRMAFIFLKLDQLIHESHSILKYMKRQIANSAMTLTQSLQMYGHLVRRNVDITYLTEYIMQRVPRDQVTRIRQQVIRHEQEDLALDSNYRHDVLYYYSRPPGRPNPRYPG